MSSDGGLQDRDDAAVDLATDEVAALAGGSRENEVGAAQQFADIHDAGKLERLTAMPRER